MFSYGSTFLYCGSFSADSKKRLGMKVEEAVETATKQRLGKGKKMLRIGVSGNTADGTDCVLPDIRYHI